MTETTQAPRDVRFQTLDDILADARAMLDRPVRSLGNWTPAQIVDHVGIPIRGATDGFGDVRLPWHSRLFFRVVMAVYPAMFLKNKFPKGIKFPKGTEAFFSPRPADAITLQQAVDELATTVERAKRERMSHPSPLVGPLSHEQWEQLHCRHAELHFALVVEA